MATSAIPSSKAMLTKSPFARRSMVAAAAATSRRGASSLHSTSTAAAAAAVAAAQGKTACSRGGGSSTRIQAPPAAVVVSRRSMSSDTTGGGSGSSGRFSDDLEKLISRAGEKVDRSGVARAAVGEDGGALMSREGDGAGEGQGVEEDPKLSARAMRFRAMISKLRPQKKAVVVKTFTPSREPLVDNLGRSFGLGRRKTSTARVWISLSNGEGGVFTVNSRPMIDYFPRDQLQNEILKPLEYTRKLGSFHVRCTAKGGGQSGQAGAIRLGLARALEAHDPWLRKFLKKEGMMERDSRMVERKKPGLKKARKAPQWVKR